MKTDIMNVSTNPVIVLATEERYYSDVFVQVTIERNHGRTLGNIIVGGDKVYSWVPVDEIENYLVRVKEDIIPRKRRAKKMLSSIFEDVFKKEKMDEKKK